MRVYLKCPCCGKTIFLVMEMELGSGFGFSYRQESSNDWECFNNFLTCLQNSQGERVYLGINEREETKIPEEYKELILNWTERGYKKPEKPQKGSSQDGKDGTNISLNFTQELKENGIKVGFNYSQVKEGIDIGLRPTDYNFAVWLRDIKKVDSDGMLNYGNGEELRAEFERNNIG